MILADTTIWVRHWRHADAAFAGLLGSGSVAVHPFVVGELALGNLARRAETLADLEALPVAPLAEHDEVLGLIEREHLWHRGIGWVDCHLLASARLGRHALWTLDRPLIRAAQRLGIAFTP